MSSQPKCEQGNKEFRAFVRVLERDGGDVDGKLLKAGSAVLFDPFEPGSFREDSPENRQKFLRLDRTWTVARRQQVWFLPLSGLPVELVNQAEQFRSAKKSFCGAVAENITAARGEPIPGVNSLPFWFRLLPWEPSIEDVRRVDDLTADLTNSLVTRLSEKSGVPGDVPWPDAWKRWLADLNLVNVYALRSMTATVHVVVAFPVAVRFKAKCDATFLPPGQEVADLVRDVYLEWSRGGVGNRGAFTFFTIGSAIPWLETVVGWTFTFRHESLLSGCRFE